MWKSVEKCGINDMVFDETHRPQDDYFNWINNKWVSENPIPDDFVRWGVFEQLHEETLKRLRGIVTDKDGDPNSGWVHCSYKLHGNRKQVLRASRVDGKTHYTHGLTI